MKRDSGCRVAETFWVMRDGAWREVERLLAPKRVNADYVETCSEIRSGFLHKEILCSLVERGDRLRLDNLAHLIKTWQIHTFPDATTRSVFSELHRAVNALGEVLDDRDAEHVGPELAETFILLICLAHLAGIHLPTSVARKHEVNTER